MRVLGIESSCDETAAAVVADGQHLLSSVVHSQIDLHATYGGVVPEVAARSHLEAINPVIHQALSDAHCDWPDIDAIAVTYAPGLVGSLLVGSLAARTLAILHHKPLYAIHHVEAHVYANFITTATNPQTTYHIGRSPDTTPATRHMRLPQHQPAFPLLALIVSGGHSQLVFFEGHGRYQLLGQTQDDAVGEAFDKVAKILGLPYPGGPAIAQAAQRGNPHAFQLPIAKLADRYDFSFSGLKTAVLRTVQRQLGKATSFPSHQLPPLVGPQLAADVAASFQYTAVKTLVLKTLQAYRALQPASVVVAGGVAANQELRRQLYEALPITIEYAPPQLCTDNAAMVASLAYFQANSQAPIDPYDLEVQPSRSMQAWNM